MVALCRAGLCLLVQGLVEFQAVCTRKQWMWERYIRFVYCFCNGRKWTGKILQLLRISWSLVHVELASCCFFFFHCIVCWVLPKCVLLYFSIGLRLKYVMPGPQKCYTKWPPKKQSETCLRSCLRFMQPLLLSNWK